MIWEVDDDHDRSVDMREMTNMFSRCRADKTGSEPRKLYNVVDFIMADKDEDGRVSFEEVMGLLFLRYGNEETNRVRSCGPALNLTGLSDARALLAGFQLSEPFIPPHTALAEAGDDLWYKQPS